MLTAFFINLGQRAFDKGRSATHNGDNPHPEHSAIAAQANGSGNTDNIARANAGCSGDHQGLEGRHGVFSHRLFQNNTNSLLKHAQLHQASAQGVVQANCHQHHDQQIAVHKITNLSHNSCKHQKTSLNYNSYLIIAYFYSPRKQHSPPISM